MKLTMTAIRTRELIWAEASVNPEDEGSDSHEARMQTPLTPMGVTAFEDWCQRQIATFRQMAESMDEGAR